MGARKRVGMQCFKLSMWWLVRTPFIGAVSSVFHSMNYFRKKINVLLHSINCIM